MAGGVKKRATVKDQGRRGLASKILIGAGIAGFAAIAVREFPSLRREIKIWLM
ncbi:MAG TPA: hypothetical protein VE733_27415 [Streptosporangiaceae bacterium]|jgi:hypothetical protein|nr:hypothetical protein [Streptosporangiaceae bacterium]